MQEAAHAQHAHAHAERLWQELFGCDLVEMLRRRNLQCRRLLDQSELLEAAKLEVKACFGLDSE